MKIVLNRLNQSAYKKYWLVCLMAYPKDESNPFSDWSSHINKPVYSIDGKRLGLLETLPQII
ncbi:MAG: hypothetical protein WAK17_28570 [Candidatus Nitrosopolaris sp.]